MAKFTLLVTSSPFDQQGPVTALNFVRAAIDSQHQICGVFFYQAGVHNANAWQSVPSDEYQLYPAWLEVAKQGVPLHVCVTAAARRGVINDIDATEQEFTGSNLQPPFEASGLGQLIELINDADRVVQF